MNKSQAEKEINAMEAFAYAMIEKAARLRLALGVSTPGAFKKRKAGDLTEEQEARIIARRKKYFQKKAEAATTTTA